MQIFFYEKKLQRNDNSTKKIFKGIKAENNKPLFFKNIKLNGYSYSENNINNLNKTFEKLNISNEN